MLSAEPSLGDLGTMKLPAVPLMVLLLNGSVVCPGQPLIDAARSGSAAEYLERIGARKTRMSETLSGQPR